ncbi:hypothetical protein TraAM80_08243 [Trypanosoma rangeli]|uniref:Uncharacterized protein n=1 Tax=Trypanosoma rangeli TaxID=5698 RepID=A0A3R7N9Z8_TRYRA|nr:uncharacterized protein TraAM80_08243 [Trypanosoma rangeli]RNE99332.1 hypothetical protein TraAM80_08243 [Trypanosoma rangeli]|eukprot:RNE99332.1 hypothetical protein TraAM80_08243 [Trypanosoma rangeli]
MGGDRRYSAYYQKDNDKKCYVGVAKPSLNCIFEWNQGLFEDANVKYRGVPFYRGSLHSLAGAGPLNGYESYWHHGYPAHGQLYLISRLDTKGGSATATWYDGAAYAFKDSDMPSAAFGIVCEVQDVITTATTEAPTTTTTEAPTRRRRKPRPRRRRKPRPRRRRRPRPRRRRRPRHDDDGSPDHDDDGSPDYDDDGSPDNDDDGDGGVVGA